VIRLSSIGFEEIACGAGLRERLEHVFLVVVLA
jgi:hypothetical protein